MPALPVSHPGGRSCGGHPLTQRSYPQSWVSSPGFMVKLCPCAPTTRIDCVFRHAFSMLGVIGEWASLRAGAGAAGESGGEIGVDRLGDGLAHPRPPLV